METSNTPGAREVRAVAELYAPPDAPFAGCYLCVEVADGALRAAHPLVASREHPEFGFEFYVPRGNEQYCFKGAALRKHRHVFSDVVFVGHEQAIESFGEAAAAAVAAHVLSTTDADADADAARRVGDKRPEVWARVFGLLSASRQVALAVANLRLVRFLSNEAAAAYAEEHPALAEAGDLL